MNESGGLQNFIQVMNVLGLIMIGALTANYVASRIYSQKTQNIYIEVFCEKGSYLCRIDDPCILKKTEFHGNVTEMKPSKDSSFMRYMVEESEATSYHLDAHMCCLADFARQVYGIEYGQYIASFQEAFQSQIAISANML